jgi:membrane protease YdiL (CAAX protease family)
MLAFFEEIGWRAWMLPRLIQQSSVKKGIIFSAAIWAFWHMPFVLGGMNVIPGMALGEMLLLYPIGLFGAGLFLGWVWYKSQSIWMVSLAHGSLNNWGQYAFKFMRDGASAPHEWPWLYTSVNVAMLLAGVLVLLVLNTEESSG